MKIAKPTNEDIDKSFELLRALRILSYDLNPFEKQDSNEIGEPDEPPPLKDSDKSAALDQVIDLYNECNITFLLPALNTLISEENQVIDQDSDTLDFSQKIKQHEQDSKRLDWLESHIMKGGYLPIGFDGSFFFNPTEPDAEWNIYPNLRNIMDEIIKECTGEQNETI